MVQVATEVKVHRNDGQEEQELPKQTALDQTFHAVMRTPCTWAGWAGAKKGRQMYAVSKVFDQRQPVATDGHELETLEDPDVPRRAEAGVRPRMMEHYDHGRKRIQS